MLRFRHGVEWSPSFAKILCQFPSGIHPTIMHNKKASERARSSSSSSSFLYGRVGSVRFDSVRFGSVYP